MRTSGTSLALALALAAAACDCSGAAAGASPAAWWVGEAGAARVLAVAADGRVLDVAAAAPALDAPVRAVAGRGDGSFVVLQEVAAGAAPGVLVRRDGTRIASLAAEGPAGATLFDADAPPWAAAEAADGRIWVTGRPSPVLYERDGTWAATAVPVSQSSAGTRGVAALPDGRVLVTWGANGAALYAPDGASVEALAVSVGAAYSGVDAVAVRPEGGLVLAVLRHGVTTDGVLVDVALGPGSLAATGDPEASARLPTLPSAIVATSDAVVAGPALGRHAEAACAEALSADLRERRGCVVPGAHRGIAAAR
ncbi:MAG TPA: hypothetical protein VFL83_07495 [Anaeromyxobacter sp.]|nr:hypothetical protein [Anaeromyxobacter sp.]